ncbi:hypothetical protein HanRHA438_Chr07g0298811 [Helianthus annuus]|uniref:Uncharacterized protein n=1 Tax=Helianthus annuus TaxID=4232 RepID=A0A9K3NF52_HELAN|nr:hypothetical protein HanXRQr2_Chr07g0288291 [Helianthus annuus]KAJ0549708.1 hypothetical protein HanHA300_Chr07g0236971 [Helianthus annuus]KAJ0562663.1 hypothetical protein HanHA89_Chr07g0254151 [Helianthus annuus]KAJ0728038.1 hypothetical protein HanLR1_Chr07g0236911 [Helianthus annuus]KAJ0904187.1 hypothetical protein HanPSC8_Chr07g0279081 [Helianthus annuus]
MTLGRSSCRTRSDNDFGPTSRSFGKKTSGGTISSGPLSSNPSENVSKLIRWLFLSKVTLLEKDKVVANVVLIPFATKRLQNWSNGLTWP